MLVCYSIDSYSSFENIQAKWILEVRHFCPGIPVVLLGLKSDLRNDETGNARRNLNRQISPEEGRKLAKNIGKDTEEMGVSGWDKCDGH